MASDKKKLVLIGFASSSRNLAPAKDDNTEVWSLNHAYSFIGEGDWSRWFEIHPFDHLLKDIDRSGKVITGNQHLAWLAQDHGDRPIYMQRHFDEIKNSVAYPREELNAWFASQAQEKPGFFAPDYYTSTISQMLALAMWEQATGKQEWSSIEIYGVDLLQEAEWSYQRIGAEYLIGMARGMGIPVYVPAQSALCKASYTYGYSEPPDYDSYTPLVTFFEKQRDAADQKVVEAKAHYHTMHGAVQMAEVSLAQTLADESKAAITAKRDETRKKMEEYAKAVIALEAQKSALDACVAWTKAHAQGMVLQA